MTDLLTLPHERYTLANGLRLLVTPMPTMYSATIALFVGTGSRAESDDEAGSAHLIEHMLFKGTARRPSPQTISQEVENVGGIINASTDKETTVYWAKVAAHHLPLAIDLLADMLLHSRFDAADVETEKRVVVEELGMTIDSPQDWVHTIIDELAWPNQPVGREVAGSRDSVARLTREGLLDFFRMQYSPHRAVLTIAGPVSPSEAHRLIAEAFGAWVAPEPPPVQPAVLAVAQHSVRLDSRDTEQASLCLATPGVSRVHPDRHACELLNSILGGAMSSRLFVELRERRGLVYDVHSYTNKLAESGTVVISAGAAPDNTLAVIDAILAELHRLRTEPVTAVELTRAQENYKGRLLMGLEDTHSVAGWSGAQELLLGRVFTPQQIIAQVEAVTVDDLTRVAGDLFDPATLHLAVIGPFEDDAPFRRVMRSPHENGQTGGPHVANIIP